MIGKFNECVQLKKVVLIFLPKISITFLQERTTLL